MRHGTIDLIFEAAIEEFADSGFERAKMDAIAGRAGVAKGTIYYHFKGKEELFVALMNEGIDKLLERLQNYNRGEKDVIVQLKNILQVKVEYLLENVKFATLLLTEVWGSEKRQQEFAVRIRQVVELIENVLRSGIANRHFDLPHPSEAAAAIFGAVSVAVLQSISRQSREADPTEQAQILTEMLEQLLLVGVIGISPQRNA